TMVDGEIVKSGSYPTNEEFFRLFGVSLDTIKPAIKVNVNKCCCGPKGCC
ncbi:MAG TPA: arsenical resistance operon transcriptional repressor ArsD, partial [Treponema sp.]|nr:arsenical resistance operon transcriptional repressor ArsD [Treponema sp.]